MEQVVETEARDAIWENLDRVLGVNTGFVTRGRKSDAGTLRNNSINMMKKARRFGCTTIREYLNEGAVFSGTKDH